MDNHNTPQTPINKPSSNKEWQLLERLLLNAQHSDKKERLWKNIFRVIILAYLSLIFLSLVGASCNGLLPKSSGSDFVGIINVQGMIAADKDANARSINKALQAGFESEATALILNINSPGGSPVQSGYVYDEIMRLKAEYPDKKLYAVIADLGASGAYYIAAAADEIYVDKASIVGSIGVIMQNFNAEELMQKIGVKPRTLTAGKNKDILSPFKTLTPAQETHVRTMLNEVHQQFIDAVKKGRGDRLKLETDGLFSGLFWSGEHAITIGLADGLGSVDTVARDIIGTEKKRNFTPTVDPLQKILKKYSSHIAAGALESLNTSAQMQ